MEYNFISKATFENIISKYISSLSENRQEKALINKNLFERIKKILLDPSNKEIDTRATCEWAKKRFILEEISLGDYRIIVISDNKSVLIVKKMYEVLCRTHAEIDNHAGQKQLWKSIKQNWSFVRQEIVEKFVNNCTICATRKPSFHPLANKPIIAKNYLSRVQVVFSQEILLKKCIFN
ncbi:hypothetical protein RhiirC2_663234 [Rhizophagus irregularis]|uniref:Uncharacterized protein n=1 Tax=Rhizophagus irregularis TaxID=588596 RepID=A0A2N1N0T5_9GLOM|nr:hypothetical protein RhiirC2_663234 [Rhizophagus irregularis]